MTLLFFTTLFTLGYARVSEPCISTRILPTQTVTAGEDAQASRLPNRTAPYTTVIQTDFTTFCPGPTSFSVGEVTYTATEATALTITNCPCTITMTGSSRDNKPIAGADISSGMEGDANRPHASSPSGVNSNSAAIQSATDTSSGDVDSQSDNSGGGAGNLNTAPLAAAAVPRNSPVGIYIFFAGAGILAAIV